MLASWWLDRSHDVTNIDVATRPYRNPKDPPIHRGDGRQYGPVVRRRLNVDKRVALFHVLVDSCQALPTTSPAIAERTSTGGRWAMAVRPAPSVPNASTAIAMPSDALRRATSYTGASFFANLPTAGRTSLS